MKDQKRTKLAVEGMTCHSCVRHVDQALRDVDGVGEVRVDLDGGEAVIEHAPDEGMVAALIEALREAGYGSRRVD